MRGIGYRSLTEALDTTTAVKGWIFKLLIGVSTKYGVPIITRSDNGIEALRLGVQRAAQGEGDPLLSQQQTRDAKGDVPHQQ